MWPMNVYSVSFEQTQVSIDQLIVWLIDWQVVRMILKLLEDKNGEVQNLAVKWWKHSFLLWRKHTIC